MLVIMFGSTAILPPRTKRWAEAKVLADCINIKVRWIYAIHSSTVLDDVITQVSKLYLYNNEHALALSHHNTHMRKFGDFSRGWGIGEETFEFWSWMARQCVSLSVSPSSSVVPLSRILITDIASWPSSSNKAPARHSRFLPTNRFLHPPPRIPHSQPHRPRIPALSEARTRAPWRWKPCVR
jgi:hypothetical protein